MYRSAAMMLAALVVALLAAVQALSVLPSAQLSNAIAGPFRIVPDHMGSCPPNMKPPRKHYFYELAGFRDRKVHDVWYYSANFTTLTTLNDNYTYFHTVDSWKARGGWATNAFTWEIAKPCTFARTHFPQYWRMAMKKLFNDPTHNCPIPPLTFTVRNQSTDFDITMPPAFYYGKFRVTIWLVNSVTKELVACERAYISVVPKDRRGRCRIVGDDLVCT